MNFIRLARRGIVPLFLLIPIFIFAKDTSLYENKTWKNLLHLDIENKPSINTSTFLLSYDNFSSKNELEKTIKAFKSDKKYICKYPARYLWLSKNMNLEIKKFDLRSCNDFTKYIDNTTPNSISLVFVSEDVKNPSSMMGHIFFKLDGVNYKNENVQNSVSFFTIIDTFNLPYLAIQSTLLGMKGYFILKPYSKQIAQYTKNKNRNIWEYTLDLSDDEIKLLSYHFWELKDIDITYYFTGYNCATIVDEMLNIVSKSSSNNSFALWVSPKDVIKKAANHNLIKDIKVNNNTSLDRDPLYSQNDSQISLIKDANETYISFLPASHTIFDDNRQYFFESSLKIAEIKLKLNDKIKIDELNIFTMKSLVPWNKTSRDFSSELKLNYMKQYNKNLEVRHIYNTSYSKGFTYKLSDNIFIFDLFGAGLAYGNNRFFPYIKNEIGMIIYEVYNMKTTFQYRSYFNSFKAKQFINELDITQSTKLNNNFRVDLKYIQAQTKSLENEKIQLRFNYIF